jgi:hypothetical protein
MKARLFSLWVLVVCLTLALIGTATAAPPQPGGTQEQLFSAEGDCF